MAKEVLGNFIPSASIVGDLPDGGVPPSLQNKIWLLQNSPTFEKWITNLATNVRSFNAAVKQKEYDNLRPSPNGA